MKLLWQDLPAEGKIEVDSRVKLKRDMLSYVALGKVPEGTKGTVVGFLTLEYVYVQWDNFKKPSEIHTRHLRKGSDNGWIAAINCLELL
jgi:hypothetical protein